MVLYCLIYLQIYLQDYRSPVPASPAVTLETYFVVVCLSFWGLHQVLERKDNHSMHRNEHICAGLKQDSMWVWAQVLICVTTNDLIVLSTSPICGDGHMMHTGCIECQADIKAGFCNSKSTSLHLPWYCYQFEWSIQFPTLSSQGQWPDGTWNIV